MEDRTRTCWVNGKEVCSAESGVCESGWEMRIEEILQPLKGFVDLIGVADDIDPNDTWSLGRRLIKAAQDDLKEYAEAITKHTGVRPVVLMTNLSHESAECGDLVGVVCKDV